MHESFSCSIYLPRLDMVSHFNFRHANRCVVAVYWDFNYSSLITNDVEHFYVHICHLYKFFGDEYDQTFHYFIIVLFVFLLNFNCSLCIYRYKSFMRQVICNYSLPVYGLSFYSLNNVFEGEDDLILIKSINHFLFLVSCLSSVTAKKLFPNPK